MGLSQSTLVDVDGINLWYNQPSSFYFNGTHSRSYFAYTNSEAQVVIRYYDHDGKNFSQEIVIADLPFRPDDHFSAAVQVIESGPNVGRILLAFSYHSSALTIVMSDHAETIQSFSSVGEFDGGFTYPSFVPSGESYDLYFRLGLVTDGANHNGYAQISGNQLGDEWGQPELVTEFGEPWYVYGFPPKSNGEEVFLPFYYYQGRVPGAERFLGYAISKDDGKTWSSKDGPVAALSLDNALELVASANASIIDTAYVDGEWLVSLTYVENEYGVGGDAVGKIIRVSDGAVLHTGTVAVNYYSDGFVFDDVDPHFAYYSTPASNALGAGKLQMLKFGANYTQVDYEVPFVNADGMYAIRPGNINNADTVGSLTWIDVEDYNRYYDFSTGLHASPDGFNFRSWEESVTGISVDLGVLQETSDGGSYDLYVGSQADDNIIGRSVADIITTLGGNDTILAGDGDDWLDGGAGDDIIFAGAGSDFIESGAGTNYVNGGIGYDTLFLDGLADEFEFVAAVSVAYDLQVEKVESVGEVTIFASIEKILFGDGGHGILSLSEGSMSIAFFSSGETGDLVKEAFYDINDRYAWQQKENEFSPNGQLTMSSVNYDYGMRYSTVYNEGKMISFTRFDLDESRSWVTSADFFNESGALLRKEVTFDDGKVYNTDYLEGVARKLIITDSHDAYAWDRSERSYSAEGNLTEVSLLYDDGIRYATTYEGTRVTSRIRSDLGDTRSWATVVEVFDLDDALVQKEVTFDDGKVYNTEFFDGVHRKLTITDSFDIYRWESSERNYDDQGDLISTLVQYDDGSFLFF